MNDDILVRVENLHRTYKADGVEVPALRGIDLSVSRGSFVAIQGRSGSGKTTLLNCIGALDYPTRGRVWVDGRDITTLPERERTLFRRRHIGFVFQSFALVPTLSAAENVDVPLRLAGVDAAGRRQRVQACLEMVGLATHAGHRPCELSGGQQQRVAIARAIALNPPLLLADEPTGELDSASGAEILALFRSLVDEQNLTVILAGHDPAVAQFADEIHRIVDGRLA